MDCGKSCSIVVAIAMSPHYQANYDIMQTMSINQLRIAITTEPTVL